MSKKKTDRLQAIKQRRMRHAIQWGGPPSTGCEDVDWLIERCELLEAQKRKAITILREQEEK